MCLPTYLIPHQMMDYFDIFLRRIFLNPISRPRVCTNHVNAEASVSRSIPATISLVCVQGDFQESIVRKVSEWRHYEYCVIVEKEGKAWCTQSGW